MRTPQIPHPGFSSAIHNLPRTTAASLKRSLLDRVDAHLCAEYLIHSLLSHIEGLKPRHLMARMNRARSPSLARGIVNDLWVALTRGGIRPGEEVRDGSHGDNRCCGNRCGITPTAAPLRPQIGPALSGSGLYNALGRALWTPPWRGPSLCVLEALRGTSGAATMSTSGGPGTHPRAGQLLRARRIGFFIGSEFPRKSRRRGL